MIILSQQMMIRNVSMSRSVLFVIERKTNLNIINVNIKIWNRVFFFLWKKLIITNYLKTIRIDRSFGDPQTN